MPGPRLSPRIAILSAGAVKSAGLLLASADGNNPRGVANRSDQVGRHFMNHNLSALLAVDPREKNDSIYQKTMALNDFYLDDGRGGGPLGNIQLLGRVSGSILKANIEWAPEWALNAVSSRAVDWLLMSEDLPRPESRVLVKDGRIAECGNHEALLKKGGLYADLHEVQFRKKSLPCETG
jgi:choline dehydrogenase-like flavoprotein